MRKSVLQPRHFHRIRSGVSALLVGLLLASGFGASGFAATAASAAELGPASFRIEKNVIVGGVTYGPDDEIPTVEVGEEFLWQITIICDQITDQ